MPKFPGNKLDCCGIVESESWEKEILLFARYIIDMVVPWSHSDAGEFPRTVDGFAALIKTWNKRSASIINRQRFRFFPFLYHYKVNVNLCSDMSIILC